MTHRKLLAATVLAICTFWTLPDASARSINTDFEFSYMPTELNSHEGREKLEDRLHNEVHRYCHAMTRGHRHLSVYQLRNECKKEMIELVVDALEARAIDRSLQTAQR